MPAGTRSLPTSFDPAAYATFRFLDRGIDERGTVRLRYGLDDSIELTEEFELPLAAPPSAADRERVAGILALLHWVAGVSYYKTAAPPAVECDPCPPAAARLLEALYSEGLGEFAYANRLPAPPRPRFPVAPGPTSAAAGSSPAADPARATSRTPAAAPRRVLVPVGGGKDSAVALEVVRRRGAELALFSIGEAEPIRRTVAVAGLPHLVARRRLDPGLAELNRAGALNGHVPITAIVSCVALLTAALRGFDAVAMANERSASAGNLEWGGIEVNHQFSKGIGVEAMLREALAELGGGVEYFSVLRPASELAIARAFARLPAYHPAFSSCNANFRLDGSRPAGGWCRDCPKCRFVFLILAPFTEPAAMAAIFGADMLADESQAEGFALLAASGGPKPFECVGEVEESRAAMRMLTADPRWREHPVVRRLGAALALDDPAEEDLAGRALALSDDHFVPAGLMPAVRALLGA